VKEHSSIFGVYCTFMMMLNRIDNQTCGAWACFGAPKGVLLGFWW
jgi:hypothetical protein